MIKMTAHLASGNVKGFFISFLSLIEQFLQPEKPRGMMETYHSLYGLNPPSWLSLKALEILVWQSFPLTPHKPFQHRGI